MSFRVDAIPPRVSPEEFYETLLESLDEGEMSDDYSLPRGWRVTVIWRNRYEAKPKSGPWAEVMEESSGTSGWDTFTRSYIHFLLRAARREQDAEQAEKLETARRRYEEADMILRRKNETGELSDIRTTIERTKLRQAYQATARKLRGGDA